MRRYLPIPVQRSMPRLRRRSRRTVGDYGYVFIVTYGRSGSTLLMSLLNAIPGYKIHGENYNALFRLFQANTAITRGYKMGAGAKARHSSPQSPWYGILRARPRRFRQELLESFLTHVLRPEPGDRVLGFKEIRYTPSHVPDLDAYLEFLRDSFPNCKIIFNHRNPADVAKSAWWALNERSQEQIEAADARMWTIPADARHFHFCYDEIDDDLGNIRELLRFLGEELDERVIREVLATPVSPTPAKYAKAAKAAKTTEATQTTEATRGR